MDIRTSTQGDKAILSLQGRFDFSGHRVFREAFKAALANAAIRSIEIDLAGVDYLDSSALGMLLLSRENADSAGKRIALARAAGAVKQVLDIANFNKLFEIR